MPYYGLWSYSYLPAYNYGYFSGYGYRSGYDPWYAYGYSGAYSTQYFDVDVYELDRGTDYVSVGEPAVSVYQNARPVESRSFGAQTTENPIDDAVDGMLAQGQDAMVAGRYDDARRLFSQAMFLDDLDGRAKLLFALASLGRGEVELAGLALGRALLTTPELIDNPWDLRTVFPTDDAGLPDETAFQRQLDELDRYLSDPGGHPLRQDGLAGARLLKGYLYFGWGDVQRAHSIFAKLALADQRSGIAGSQDALATRLRDSAARIMHQTGR